MNGINRVFPLDHPEAAGPESHIVGSEEAMEMVKALPEISTKPFNSIKFLSPALNALTANEGHEGFAFMLGYNGDHITAVIFSVDRDGKILVGPDFVAIENGEPCPPICPIS